MPSEYETAFTINPVGPAAGVPLLREVTERIKTELLSPAPGPAAIAPGASVAIGPDSTADVAPAAGPDIAAAPYDADETPDIETGHTESAAYTRISAERNHPTAPQYRMRLEIRLCTHAETPAPETRAIPAPDPEIRPNAINAEARAAALDPEARAAGALDPETRAAGALDPETRAAGALNVEARAAAPDPEIRPNSITAEARAAALDPETRIAGTLSVEVRSRFLSPADAAPPDTSAGPPRFLRFIAAQFQCAIGPDPLTPPPRRITAANAETYARQSILNPQRRLPILALSQDRQGRTPIDPDRAQRTLLGVATVALLENDAPTALTRYLTGRWFASFNGAMQILWPACRPEANDNGPRILYPANPAAGAPQAQLLREIQQACLGHAPETDFDAAFSDARVSVIMERNHLLETMQQNLPHQPGQPSTAETESLQRDLRKHELAAREAARKWRNALTTIANLEQELAAANTQIDQLTTAQITTAAPDTEKETLRQLRAENRELREERNKLRETNAVLNNDNQLLRQQIRRSINAQDARTIRLDTPHPGNVTTLNYAINLYRDPMRRYIINNLDAHDDDALRETLRMSVEIHPYAKEKPEALIDVNDFHNIVTANRPYFSNSKELAWNLRQIKDIRNRAAHPPPDGIRDDFTQYGLARIAEALETIGARQELMEITRLQTRIHPN